MQRSAGGMWSARTLYTLEQRFRSRLRKPLDFGCMLPPVKSHHVRFLAGFAALLSLAACSSVPTSAPAALPSVASAHASRVASLPFVFVVRYSAQGEPMISSSLQPIVTRSPSGLWRITFAAQ